MEIWKSAVTASARLMENLMRRFATLGTRDDLLMCAELLQRSPDAPLTNRLVDGFSKAFEGRSIPPLPTELVAQLSRVESRFATLLGIRRSDEVAIAAAFERIQDESIAIEERVQLIRALGEVHAQETAQSILASRMVWSQQLLDAIDGGKIPGKRINQDTISRLSWHRDSNLQT